VISARKDPGTGALVDRYLSDNEWRDIAATYWTTWAWRPGTTIWAAGGSRCATPTTTCTSSPRWPRQDGRRVSPHNDYYRAGEASREVEAKYGLSPTAASDRTAAKRPTYAETQKTARSGQAEPVRDTLRR
jgi:hypothetical protein